MSRVTATSSSAVLLNGTNTTHVDDAGFLLSPTSVNITRVGVNVTFQCQHSSPIGMVTWQLLKGSQIVAHISSSSPPLPHLYIVLDVSDLSSLTVTVSSELVGSCFRCYVPSSNSTSSEGCIVLPPSVPQTPADVDTFIILAAVLPFVCASVVFPCVTIIMFLLGICYFKRANTNAIRVAPTQALQDNPTFRQNNSIIKQSRTGVQGDHLQTQP